jgi:two-component system CheB/CheR fusion protein
MPLDETSDHLAEALSESERRLRFISDHSPVLIVYFGADKIYKFVNKPYAERFGLRPQDIVGKSLVEMLGQEAYASIEPYVETVLRGERVEYETHVPYHDLGPRYVWAACEPEFDDSGKVIGFVAAIIDITARKQAEEALRQSEERFSKAFEASPLAMSITSLRTGRLLEVNETFTRLSGYTREEAVGRTTLELGVWSNPNDREAEMALVLGSGQVRKIKYRFRMKDGTELIGLLSAERLELGGEPCALTVIENITERERAEASLRENEERLRLALEAGQVGTWDWDVASNRVTWSETVYHFHGLELGEFGGRVEDFADIVHPDDRERVNAAISAAVEGKESYSIEMRVVWPDGTVRWIATKGKVIFDPEGQPVRMLGATVDITDRKLAEEALRDADRRKDEFLAMLAHELRNPLAPIRNAVQLLRRLGPSEPEIQWTREVIDRQVEHLVRLVDDLLDVSRITQGKITLKKEKVDLITIIGRALETSRPLIDSRKHRLTVSLPEQPLRLEGDTTRLTQVVSNLLNNAAKFTPEGGQIWLVAEAQNGQVVLRIRDTGMGIPEDLLPHVFDLFRQADRSLDRSQGGLGVGLTLVRSLLEMHGGTVEAYSDGPGRGSEFVVRLPAFAEPGEAVEDASAVESHMGNSACCRVLVVDDNSDSAESIALLLELNGHDVRMAHDGPAALEIARSFHPQVVVLDIGLPGMDGYEVAKRLRSEAPMQNVILIALTGYGQSEDRQRSIAAGFNHHLVKPVDPEVLQTLIASHANSGAEKFGRA